METSRASAVETFTTVTGADSATAEHVLDAHNWDVNRGVSFFLDRGPEAALQLAANGRPSSRGVEELVDDEPPPLVDSRRGDDYEPIHNAEPPWEVPDEDADLQQVLALSLQTAEAERERARGPGAFAGGRAFEQEAIPVDSDDDDPPVANHLDHGVATAMGDDDDDVEEIRDLRSLANHRRNRRPITDPADLNFPDVARRTAFGMQTGFLNPGQLPGVASRRGGRGQGVPAFVGPLNGMEDDPDEPRLNVFGIRGQGYPGLAFDPLRRTLLHGGGRTDMLPPLRQGPQRGIDDDNSDDDIDEDRSHTTGEGDDHDEDAGHGREPDGRADMDWNPPAAIFRGPPFGPRLHRGPVPVPAPAAPYEHIVLPEGVDYEEARMMEAVMLGIPYQGRIPDFNAPRPPPPPLSPSVVAQRRVREEQDAAYEASLQLDKEKQAAARLAREKEEAEKDAAERAQREARETAAAEQAAYEEEIATKASTLPAEPSDASTSALTVLVRFPDGRRVSRRFAKKDMLKSLFDYVDVEGAPEVKPRTYNLVTQFPRRVLKSDTQGTLSDNGLSQRQEAVFLELL